MVPSASAETRRPERPSCRYSMRFVLRDAPVMGCGGRGGKAAAVTMRQAAERCDRGAAGVLHGRAIVARSRQSQAISFHRHPRDGGIVPGAHEERRGNVGDDRRQSRLDHRGHAMWPSQRTGQQAANRPAARSDAARSAPHQPDFTGLCAALLQLSVEAHVKSARARRREGRNEAAGENLVARGRYPVAPSPQNTDVFPNILRINNRPSKIFSTFKLAPGCSLIHDWLRASGFAPLGVGIALGRGRRRCTRSLPNCRAEGSSVSLLTDRRAVNASRTRCVIASRGSTRAAATPR